MKVIAGTARQMGVEVEGIEARSKFQRRVLPLWQERRFCVCKRP
jgi:hypothetical protein